MPETNSKPVPRKSAFSCEACRKRKVKCNGASPSCSRCAARGETCVYSLTPTLSYTKSLEARIAELEAELDLVRSENKDQKSSDQKPKVEEVETKVPLERFARHSNGSQDGGDTLDLARDIEGLKMEDDGRISFHGPTSLFQLPSGIPQEDLNPVKSTQELDGRKERLINNAWRERAFEQLATIPSEPKISRLLDPYDGGTQFFNRAVDGLYESLKQGNGQIPIVQSLLLLSAQECGRGNRTQAWLYSGMAFRLVEDLGITIDSRKYSGSVQFSDEDVEIRNRLFWSCYFWDKLVSLYFGRSPIIQDTPVSPPQILLDDTAEIEIWTPHGVVFPEGTHYPPTQAHSTSCFMRMCSLSEILNQIIIHIYDPVRQSTETQILNCVHEQGENLEKWWTELPSFLKLIVNDLPAYCPPSHIVTLNCIYHITNILLHRPMLCSKPFRSLENAADNAKHLVQCLSSATSIISLYDLYRRTFGDSHVVLSLAYSLYTASSIFLLEIQALKYASASTLEKLRYCIVALERVRSANPVINTALGLVEKELQKLHINILAPIHPDPQPTSSRLPPQSSQDTSRSDHQQPQHQQPTLQSPSNYTLPPHGAFSITPPPFTEQNSDTSFTMDPSLLNPSELSQEHMYDIAPELFEAFSYVEPMPTNVGQGGFDTGWPSSGS
ncbi:Fungal specific transcription factor, putative [Coccidioides posadasii C735 delta SOWgp]|uniref:Fungal specific transcription factor, putative n=1 Tax=Coccidioides posadasii (strain C735) TaxID=222929 RepID=C5P8A5_COCP7|nr:Fungal specific transcription factor, putative [Coccidioides posadasii C735 delta SOWgp]EER26876.1 Fungal specific transcription factor, putative [Coccidioides posadasii C735 delta SOWgp]|eukprot:XP_003069021.1 Fungal specific transcription factor, putative [Coccidioides posadasii C735 delta SOWgp]